MSMLSIFLYVMFNHNDTSNEDFLLCDDFRDNDKNIIEGSIHSTINIVLDILMISSIVMSLIDCNNNLFVFWPNELLYLILKLNRIKE